ERPRGLRAQPVAQLGLVPADEHQILRVGFGGQQRTPQQRPERRAPPRRVLVVHVPPLPTSSVISMRCSGPVRTPSSVTIRASPPPGTDRKSTRLNSSHV